MRRQYVQPIERTGKLWKLQMIAAVLLAITGWIVYASEPTIADKPTELAMGGVVAIFIGAAWFVFAKLGAWWNHG